MYKMSAQAQIYVTLPPFIASPNISAFVLLFEQRLLSDGLQFANRPISREKTLV